MDIKADITAILQKKLKSEISVSDDAKLTSLNIDSLDLVEIMFEIEDKFQIQLPQNNEAMQDATVKDLLAWVAEAIEQKANGTVPAPAEQPGLSGGGS